MRFFYFVLATNVYGVTLVTLGTLAVTLVLIMYIDTLRYILKNSSSRVKAHSAFVVGVYPVMYNFFLITKLFYNFRNYLLDIKIFSLEDI